MVVRCEQTDDWAMREQARAVYLCLHALFLELLENVDVEEQARGPLYGYPPLAGLPSLQPATKAKRNQIVF